VPTRTPAAPAQMVVKRAQPEAPAAEMKADTPPPASVHTESLAANL